MFPIGFEFNPSGEELIKGYLLPWVTGRPLPWNGISVRQIYGPSSEPWKVLSDVESHWHSRMEEKGAIKYTVYCFTSLSKMSKSNNSKRVSRTAGDGTWGGQTGPKKIKNSINGQTIGQSKMFAFEPSKDSEEADLGHWTMHEYSLGDELIGGQSDFVVCKITKTVKKKNNKSEAQPLAVTNELYLPVNNGGMDVSGGNGFDGAWVRLPQIVAIGDGNGDMSFYPTEKRAVDPFAPKKRAAEEVQQHGEGALKRQKTSGANDNDDLSAFEAELERDLVANDDEEPTNAAELEGNDVDELYKSLKELENLLR